MTGSMNRLLWTALGLLLLGGGGVGAAAALGHFPGTDAQSPLLWSWALKSWRDAGAIAPLIVAALGLVGVLAGLVLMRAQLRVRRTAARDVAVPAGQAPGATRIRGTALNRCLSADLGRVRGIRSAQVHMDGPTDSTRVAVRLDVVDDTRLPRLAADVQECLQRFSRTTGAQVTDLDITLRPAPQEFSRVS